MTFKISIESLRFETKIVKIRTIFMFMEKSRVAILVFDDGNKSLPIILITHFSIKPKLEKLQYIKT